MSNDDFYAMHNMLDYVIVIGYIMLIQVPSQHWLPIGRVILINYSLSFKQIHKLKQIHCNELRTLTYLRTTL